MGFLLDVFQLKYTIADKRQLCHDSPPAQGAGHSAGKPGQGGGGLKGI